MWAEQLVALVVTTKILNQLGIIYKLMHPYVIDLLFK